MVVHPILVELHEWCAVRSARGRPPPQLAALLIERGRAYVGTNRPRGVRQHARQQCFRNAARLALKGMGTYVEGMVANQRGSFHHACITLDGERAVDPTLPDATNYQYFGIPISNTALIGSFLARRPGALLLEPLDRKLLGLE